MVSDKVSDSVRQYLAAAQVERLLRCPASRYQTALMRIVHHKLSDKVSDSGPTKGKGALKGVGLFGNGGGGGGAISIANCVMELRNICNHPCIRWYHESIDNFLCRIDQRSHDCLLFFHIHVPFVLVAAAVLVSIQS